MARLGLTSIEFAELDRRSWTGIDPILLMSHLVSAEDPADPINALQLQRFESLRQHLPGVAASLANSSGIFLGTPWHFDLLRPGAAMYGVAPTLGHPNPMQPVVRLHGRLIQSHSVDAGTGVGYNHTWTAQRTTRIATIAVGYADGYLRSLSNRGSVHFNGRSVPLIGRVSMDTLTLDVTDVPPETLVPGATFDLIDPVHGVDALAAQSQTNGY